MTKKRARRSRFETMTVDEIFSAWEDAARQALPSGLRYAAEIFAPGGAIVRRYKRAISRRMADTAHPYNAADHRNSTRVAKDIGRICGIIAADDSRRTVRLDVFQRAAELAQLHASCPIAGAGTGRWCEIR